MNESNDPEQRKVIDAARAKVNEALADLADACYHSHDGQMLTDWAVVLHWETVENDQREAYTWLSSTSVSPRHHSVGLFRIGEHIALDQVTR